MLEMRKDCYCDLYLMEQTKAYVSKGIKKAKNYSCFMQTTNVGFYTSENEKR
jgi:ferredoxin-thioredoxin reductase catalytic subunit